MDDKTLAEIAERIKTYPPGGLSLTAMGEQLRRDVRDLLAYVKELKKRKKK